MSKKGEKIKQRILEYLAGCQNGAATGEIALKLKLTRSQVTYSLFKLACEGKVVRKLKSPRVAIWYLAEKKEGEQ